MFLRKCNRIAPRNKQHNQVLRLVLFVLLFVLQPLLTSGQLKTPNKTIPFYGRSSDHSFYLGSSNGWSKTTGTSVKFFNKQVYAHLPDDYVQSDFFESEGHDIWFATYQSIVRFDPLKEKAEFFQLKLENKTLQADYYVFGIKNDTLYGSIDRKLFIFDVCNGSYKFLNIPLANKWSKLYSLGEEIHILNYFWNKVTLHLVLDASTHEVKSRNSFQFRTNDLCFYSDSELLLASEEGIKVFNLRNSDISNFPHFRNSDEVFAICRVSESHWFASDIKGDLHSIRKNGIELISNAQIEGAIIKHIWLDGKNILLSSYGYGVWMYSGNIFDFINIVYPEKLKLVSIASMTDKLVLLSTEKPPQLLDLFKSEFTPIVTNYNRSKYCCNINDSLILVQFDHKDVYPALLDKYGKYTEIKTPTPPANIIRIKYFPESEKIICSGRDGKLFIGEFDGNQIVWQDSITTNTENKGTNYLYCFKEILICTINNEYVQVYTKTGNQYNFKCNLEITGDLYAFQEDSIRNVIWIASESGLYAFSKSEFVVNKVDVSTNLESIQSLQLDKLGRLWASFSDLLYLYDPDKNWLFRFGNKSGIIIEDYTNRTGLTLSDGRMLFAGNNALVTFKAEQIQPQPVVPPVHIDNVLFNDTEVYNYRAGDLIKISPQISAVSFQVNAGHLAIDQESKISYQLVPEDDHPVIVNASEVTARYTRLKPGSYTLNINAIMSNGQWSPYPTSVQILVLTPWYATWWALLLFASIIVSCIFLISRIYYSQKINNQRRLLQIKTLQLEKQEAVEQERNRIASEMHDDLGSGLTTIKFLSNRALKNAEDEKERAVISKISQQSNALVRNMSEIIWAMNSRFDTLENLLIYIKSYAYDYLEQNEVQFQLQVPDHIPELKLSGEKRRNIFLVVKEALHNIVKHSGSSTAQILISLENSLRIAIVDQGKGMEVNANLDAGNGLYNMQTRMKTIGGTCTFSNGNGWKVEIELPLDDFFKTT